MINLDLAFKEFIRISKRFIEFHWISTFPIMILLRRDIGGWSEAPYNSDEGGGHAGDQGPLTDANSLILLRF